ncbi:MAG: carboxymuconolactone decarboxylase family protein [Deltaproteobacteria bacterium]|nr:MAG: carboxymuconolactone decarboxylase family protein [Deltaproteobacteria bacterium]TDJ06366.1 MAG: carboxymuconolactone decarboxylase family protein [Deltaproteobacteria bacterium]
MLDYAVELTRTPVEVPNELFTQLREHFDESELLELTAVIAWENYRARFNHALGIGSGGFSEGAYCPLPERPVEPTT